MWKLQYTHTQQTGKHTPHPPLIMTCIKTPQTMKLITIHTEQRCLNEHLSFIRGDKNMYTRYCMKRLQINTVVSVNNQHVDLMDVIERAHAQ